VDRKAYSRIACVDVPELPLQWLLLQNPDWRQRPVAVVDSDRPQGEILWVNERARTRRILPGMRYAAALSLAGDLHASVVPEQEIHTTIRRLSDRLRRFTPNVEPADLTESAAAGLFWLDASGLERLYDSLHRWGSEVEEALKEEGYQAAVVVGWTRFGSYALARVRRDVSVLKDAEEEREAACQVPLERLSLPPASRDALARLGITTVGGFRDLPGEGVQSRFDKTTHQFHRLASGDLQVPLQPEHPRPPAVEKLILEHPESHVGRLMVGIQQMLPSLLATLAGRAHALTELQLGLRFERLGDHLESIRPAAPTLDAPQLLELIRLRLQALRKLPDVVVELVLLAGETEAAPRQLRLFAENPKRGLDAVNRALARVRADLGDRSVVHAQLREGHLPEGSFGWQPIQQLKPAKPATARGVDLQQLVRRIQARPLPLPLRPRHEPDGWMLKGLQQGPVTKVSGPYVVSGGWWQRAVHREYHFAETLKGELLWVFFDRYRRRWFLQGRVE